MAWCRAEKRRVDYSEDFVLQGNEKRTFGDGWSAAGPGVVQLGLAQVQTNLEAMRGQLVGLPLGTCTQAEVPSLPATHVPHAGGTMNNESRLQTAQPLHMFASSTGTTVTQLASSHNTEAMEMDVDQSSCSMAQDPSTSCGMSTSSNCSSSSEQSPMLTSPSLSINGSQAPPASACPRCLAGEGGHFKHVLTSRREPYPWYF